MTENANPSHGIRVGRPPAIRGLADAAAFGLDRLVGVREGRGRVRTLKLSRAIAPAMPLKIGGSS